MDPGPDTGLEEIAHSGYVSINPQKRKIQLFIVYFSVFVLLWLNEAFMM